ncbi:bifunctional phosphoribosylaminoimidazolecarboxamide formyltransferase/IMP cyclohydrolase [Cryobacterium sp. TMT2-18-3]|uniref:bifunctional phosphoribosylaminoimidazolecarboxamide formyltransferase/IMP cyclohydrolase n=1 Tax=unclassified Cryobacterium TaxID=2649013 RepID=UPI0010692926|nr:MULTISPECIES: bifunctional phosphoribosylaminoimidazolecarboxamide formyltransferase/IMP cyclohydrolase [unclassified Cryobacterium]TFC26321.1 bifunctional phosphoribosylaminoimidazolecarboxamide formyltransferase/IMP cyclohydrolase [Cryobacterium sp. TMT2-18-2]TFC35360.1 bifunctional phosphoribosylaminoimidazolecarboxamide formyltransferase/IMP cyclohydrolase [Cryobacterium sp. TMT2-42-4]TFC64500.1 bifunctional phosphoribosylaminoimidazolecarboxamide formyltransferase/IMP cyclohydrolase [Cry
MSGPTNAPSLYRHRDVVPVQRALISVSDKTGLVDLAAALAATGVEIVSTGSTAAFIRAAGHNVTDVSAITGFPESLDGRVKTLHPGVHAGILADLRLEAHEAQLADLGIAAFQLVVVNLYPFVETALSGAVPADVIEQIDIGGPALVRAAAKNHANVAIVVDPDNYDEIIAAVEAGGTPLTLRQKLASLAFEHTAGYDLSVSAWFTENVYDQWQDDAAALDEEILEEFDAVIGDALSEEMPFPENLVIEATRSAVLRYGENSHQAAALYLGEGGQGIAQAVQRHGKEMSYNNYVDADAAVRAAYDFVAPAVAIIKHANPCGIAVANPKAPDAIASAHHRAHDCDPISAFGGVIAANRTVTLGMAETVSQIFTEVLVAPGFEPAAFELLSAKKNIRLLELPVDYHRSSLELRQISGGLLVQESDTFDNLDSSTWALAAGDEVDAATRADLEFAWKACRSVKSNAILLARGGASVGVGMGQVNRVDSCHLAVLRAGDRAAGSVAASDAFFPFADGLQVLLDAGVTAVVQPGGSVRDAEVIQAAADAGVSMYFTGERHFFH